MIVFVYHPDLDVLSTVVGRIRDRGIETFHAADAQSLIERANKIQPSVVLVPSATDGIDEGTRGLRRTFPDVPEVAIPSLEPHAELGLVRLMEALVAAMTAVVPADPRLNAGGGDVRGDLSQIPLPDLLQLLSMGRKTGTLAVATSSAAGELRLLDGEVVDAMFRRAEGMKAVVRLLGEREGAFHFVADTTPGLRRIREPISSILMEGTRQTDEVRRLREALDQASNQDGHSRGAGHSQYVLALQLESPHELELEVQLVRDVAAALGQPRTLDDLLDELPHNDLDLLHAIATLDARGAIRRMPLGDLRPSLGGPEGMVILRGLARRLRPRGYRGPGRLVLLGKEGAIRLARQALTRLAEASPGIDASGELGTDRAIESTVSLQLGESVSLEVMTIVDRPELPSLLPMVLNGAIGVVAIDRPSPRFVERMEELEIALVDARSVVDPLEELEFDPGDPTAIASVIRGAIEGMGGT